MKAFLVFTLALLLLDIVKESSAQTMPVHPEESISLEKVLCALSERYDAVHKNQAAVLTKAIEQVPEADYVQISTLWFSGYYDGESAGWTIFTITGEVVSSGSASGEDARDCLIDGLTQASSHQGFRRTWGSMNTAYPTIGAAANLAGDEVDRILESAEGLYYDLFPIYENSATVVGQPTSVNQGDLLEDPIQTRSERITALASAVERLTNFRALHLNVQQYREMWSEVTYPSKPEPLESIPFVLTEDVTDDYTFKELESSYVASLSIWGIVATAIAQEGNSWKREIHTLFPAGHSIICPGQVTGKLAYTVAAGNVWNNIEHKAGPDSVGSINFPCADTVWKIESIQGGEVTFDSSTSEISSLFFDVSDESLIQPVEPPDVNSYPGHGECNIGVLSMPNFQYRFPFNSFAQPREILGNIEFDGAVLRIYTGRVDAAKGGRTYLESNVLPYYQSGVRNYAHLRHWRVSGNLGKHIVYASQASALAEPIWNPNSPTQWPGGAIANPYSDWLNYLSYSAVKTPVGGGYIFAPYGEYYRGRNIVRQILTRDALVDIAKINDHKYAVRFYSVPSNLVPSAGTGLYEIVGSPFRTLFIEHPDQDFTVLGKVNITDGDVTHEVSKQGSTLNYRIKQSGEILYERESDWATSKTRFTIDGKSGDWFDGISDKDLAIEANGYSRLENAERKLIHLKQGDAAFEYHVDQQGRPDLIKSGSYTMTRVVDPSDATRINRVETEGSGESAKVIARGWEICPNLYEERFITATNLNASGPEDPSNLVTTIYYDNGTGANPWAVKAIRNADGTGTVFQYSTDDDHAYTTIKSGEPSAESGVPTAITRGTRSTYTFDKDSGAFLDYASFDVESGIQLDHRFTHAQSIERASFKQPTEIKSWNGESIKYGYDNVTGGCVSVTDADGNKTEIERDALLRTKSVKEGTLTTSFTYTPVNEQTLQKEFGVQAQFPDGTTKTDISTGYGLQTSSSIKKLGVGSVDITREADKSIKSVHKQTVGDFEAISQTSAGGTSSSTSGNAVEPFDTVTTTELIPDSNPQILGLKTVATHKPGGSASGIAYTLYSDGAGRSVRLEEPGANGGRVVTKYIYNGARLKSVIDPDGIVTIYQYNGVGDLVKTGIDFNKNGALDPGERSVTYGKSSGAGALEATVSLNGRVLEKRVYRPQDQEVDILPTGDNAQKTTISRERIATDQVALKAVRSGLGESKVTFKDGTIHEVRSESGGAVSSSSITRNNLDQVTEMTSTHTGIDNTTVEFTPETGMVKKVTKGDRVIDVAPTTRSGGGLMVVSSDGIKNQTTVTDAKGNLLSSSGNDQIDFDLTPPSYDDGKIKQELEIDNKKTTFTASFGGETLEKAFPGKISTERTTYSPAGRLLSRTNARKQTTTYIRENGVDVTAIQVADQTGSSAFLWRDDGLLDFITDESGGRDLIYDDKGRLEKVTYTSGDLAGKSIIYGYDEEGRQSGISVTDGSIAEAGGETVTYNYSGTNITGVVNTSSGRSALYTGDPMPNGVPRDFTYGPVTVNKSVHGTGGIDGIANSTSAAGSYNFGYSINAAGDRDKIFLPDGKEITLGYDDKGQLDSAVTRQGGLVVASSSYVTNDFGNPVSRTVNGATRTYSSPGNGLNQVKSKSNPVRAVSVLGQVSPGTSVKINGTPQAVSPQGVFFRILGGLGDAAKWVPITIRATIAGGGDAGRDAVEQLGFYTWLPPLEESIEYDLDGNRLRDSRFSYAWSCQNRLDSVAARNVAPNETAPLKVECDYDSEGRRFRKRVLKNGSQQSKTLFLYDGWRLMLEEQYDGSDNLVLVRSYAWGPDLSGTLDGAGGIGGLMEIRETKGGTTTRSIPLFDSQSVTALVDAVSGQIVAEYEYGPFGELLSAKGERADSCPLRYSTKYYDKETGFYYFGYRYYDPSTGTWISRDPLGEAGGVNLYAFCNNDPVNYVDPDGLAPLTDEIKIRLAIEFQAAADLADLFSYDGANEGVVGTLKQRRVNDIMKTSPLYKYVIYEQGINIDGLAVGRRRVMSPDGSVLRIHVKNSRRPDFAILTDSDFKAEIVKGGGVSLEGKIDSVISMKTGNAPDGLEWNKIVSSRINIPEPDILILRPTKGNLETSMRARLMPRSNLVMRVGTGAELISTVGSLYFAGRDIAREWNNENPYVGATPKGYRYSVGAELEPLYTFGLKTRFYEEASWFIVFHNGPFPDMKIPVSKFEYERLFKMLKEKRDTLHGPNWQPQNPWSAGATYERQWN